MESEALIPRRSRQVDTEEIEDVILDGKPSLLQVLEAAARAKYLNLIVRGVPKGEKKSQGTESVAVVVIGVEQVMQAASNEMKMVDGIVRLTLVRASDYRANVRRGFVLVYDARDKRASKGKVYGVRTFTETYDDSDVRVPRAPKVAKKPTVAKKGAVAKKRAVTKRRKLAIAA